MARRHEPSIAHEYTNGVCKHCHMHRSNVEQLAHVCTPARESISDEQGAKELNLSVENYRKGSDHSGGDLSPTI